MSDAPSQAPTVSTLLVGDTVTVKATFVVGSYTAAGIDMSASRIRDLVSRLGLEIVTVERPPLGAGASVTLAAGPGTLIEDDGSGEIVVRIPRDLIAEVKL